MSQDKFVVSSYLFEYDNECVDKYGECRVFNCLVDSNGYLTSKITERKNDLLQKNTKLTFKGFRKGKEPLSWVIKAFGSDMFFHHIMMEIVEQINAYKPLFIAHIIEVVSVEYSENENLCFKMVVDKFPQVDVSDGKYKGIFLKRLDDKITDEDLSEELQRLIKSKRRVVEKTENVNVIEHGNYITFDYSVAEGEANVGSGETTLAIGEPNNTWPKSFEDALMGHLLDEDMIVPCDYPDDYPNTELAGKKIVFRIKIKKVMGVNTPELNDVFAKMVGGHPTVEDLKIATMERLLKTKREKNEEEYFSQIELKLLEFYGGDKIQLPQRFLDQEMNNQISAYKKQFEVYKRSFDDWIKDNQETYNELVKTSAERIEKGSGVDIILQSISVHESVVVTPEELKEAAVKWQFISQNTEKLVPFLRRVNTMRKIVEYATMLD